MNLENYMPDLALEKAYDVTVDSLKKHGIKVVLVDLDNTLIAGIILMERQKCVNGYMTYVMREFL